MSRSRRRYPSGSVPLAMARRKHIVMRQHLPMSSSRGWRFSADLRSGSLRAGESWWWRKTTATRHQESAKREKKVADSMTVPTEEQLEMVVCVKRVRAQADKVLQL